MLPSSTSSNIQSYSKTLFIRIIYQQILFPFLLSVTKILELDQGTKVATMYVYKKWLTYIVLVLKVYKNVKLDLERF